MGTATELHNRTCKSPPSAPPILTDLRKLRKRLSEGVGDILYFYLYYPFVLSVEDVSKILKSQAPFYYIWNFNLGNQVGSPFRRQIILCGLVRTLLGVQRRVRRFRGFYILFSIYRIKGVCMVFSGIFTLELVVRVFFGLFSCFDTGAALNICPLSTLRALLFKSLTVR